MTRTCLAKCLVNTLWIQLNKEKPAIGIFARKSKKKQKPFQNTRLKAARRSSGSSILDSCSTKNLENQGEKYFTENSAQPLEEAVGSKVKIKVKKTLINMFFTPIIPLSDLRNVHLWVNSSFSGRTVLNLALVGKLKHFFESVKNSQK